MGATVSQRRVCVGGASSVCVCVKLMGPTGQVRGRAKGQLCGVVCVAT
jgi:hypothetical protein